MSEIVVNDVGSAIVANVVATLAQATINGEPIFASVGTVDNPKEFVDTADVLKSSPLPEIGIVEGPADEQNGTSDFEESVFRLTLTVLVRFKFIRKPGDTERAAMERMKWLTEAVKTALLVDRSRGGVATLVQWGGTVINGTSVKAPARALSAVANEAFYTTAITVYVTWNRVKSDTVFPPLVFDMMSDEQFDGML